MFVFRALQQRNVALFSNVSRRFASTSTLVIKKAEGIGYGERDVKVLIEHERVLEEQRIEREKRATRPRLRPQIHIAQLDTVGDIVLRYLLTFWRSPEHLAANAAKGGPEIPEEIPSRIARYPELWPPSELARGLILYRGCYTKFNDPSFWCITHIIPKKSGHFIYYGIETFRGKVLVPKIQRMTTYRKQDWYAFPPNTIPEPSNWQSVVADRTSIFRYPATPNAEARIAKLRTKTQAKNEKKVSK